MAAVLVCSALAIGALGLGIGATRGWLGALIGAQLGAAVGALAAAILGRR